MIRIAAVDDERHVLERFERMVVKNKELELCGLFESGEELLAYLKEHPLDAVFLDIEMPDINGLKLCEQVLDYNENIDIVFVTAFNQYAVEAFELQAIDYIMKPFTEERFHKTVRRLLKTKRTDLAPRKPFIQCFGDFEVFLDGKAMEWKNSKAKEILAFLVHKEGVPVNWEKISDAVWSEYNAKKAQTNFHANTYLLRRRLAEAGISKILESSRGNYRIVTEEFNCDLYEFEKIVKGNHIKRKEDYLLIKKLSNKGYMEGNGYNWSYPKAAEIEEICRIDINNFKKNK
ncbi:MAG: two-component system LytT family response regulator [Clostridium sp.]|jgi:two-component system LytT family response regulator